MSDTTQTPASWLPSLETIKAVKWMQLAKYGALALGLVLIYGVWQNAADFFKTAPVVVSDVTKADLNRLEARMEFFASKAAVDEVATRLLALEASQATKRPAKK